MLVAEALYQRHPQADEGELTRWRSHLVRESTLAVLAAEQGLPERLRLGPGELRSADWRRASLLADALEAGLAAIYLDAGIDAVRQALERIYAQRWDALPSAESLKDAKTRLQEWLQARGFALPEYALLAEGGPAHRKHFEVSACVGLPEQEPLVTRAAGRSRRRAEQEAAAALLVALRERYPG